MSQKTKSPSIKKLTKFDSSNRSKLFIFSAMIGVIGIIVLVSTFAAARDEMKLAEAFQSLAKNKPTTVKGTLEVKYNDSREFKSATLNYEYNSDPMRSSSQLINRLYIDGTSYGLEQRSVGRAQYFKLSNTYLLKNEITAKSPMYPYFKPRFKDITAVEGKWLVREQPRAGASNNAGQPYACLSQPLQLNGEDSRALKSAFLGNSPLSVGKSGDKVIQYKIQPSSKSNVNSFAKKISNLSVIKSINKCSGGIVNANLLDKTKDAFNKNDIVANVYVDRGKQITKMDLMVRSQKATVKLTAAFTYNQPVPISKPPNATSANNFFDAMFVRKR